MKGGAITTKREKRDAIDKTYSKIELREVLLTNDDKTMKRTEIRNLTKDQMLDIIIERNLLQPRKTDEEKILKDKYTVEELKKEVKEHAESKGYGADRIKELMKLKKPELIKYIKENKAFEEDEGEKIRLETVKQEKRDKAVKKEEDREKLDKLAEEQHALRKANKPKPVEKESECCRLCREEKEAKAKKAEEPKEKICDVCGGIKETNKPEPEPVAEEKVKKILKTKVIDQEKFEKKPSWTIRQETEPKEEKKPKKSQHKIDLEAQLEVVDKFEKILKSLEEKKRTKLQPLQPEANLKPEGQAIMTKYGTKITEARKNLRKAVDEYEELQQKHPY
jgi:hypothetical protein